MNVSKTNISILILSGFFMFSCRGEISEKPPVHPNPNMDFQNRFNAQEANPFFENNMAMRMPVKGTIARGKLHHNTEFYQGVDENGNIVEKIPIEVTKELLYRGKDQFEIYCQVCHGGTGDGKGIIMTGGYGFVPAPSYHTDNLRQMPDGHFFSVITNGIRTMPSYASQIKVKDRWAIVAYIRALQKSQNVTEEEMDRYHVNLSRLQQNYIAEQARQQALAQERSAGANEEVSAERGEELYVTNACQTCHTLDGTVLVGPSFKNLFGQKATFTDGSTLTVDEAYIEQSIREPSVKVVEGFENSMVPYDFLSDSEVQSLIEFIKSQSSEE